MTYWLFQEIHWNHLGLKLFDDDVTNFNATLFSRLSPTPSPYYSTLNACGGADGGPIPPVNVKLSTSYELGNYQCFYVL
jgi:hypothetical protein